jgi:DNA segregation ATPase FtsK/SpoIIIE, S-DNA-T family
MTSAVAVADVVGVVVATVARNSLMTTGVGPRPALRVTGFAQEEVVAALAWLQKLTEEHGSTGLVIKVGTKSPIDGVPDDFILREGETLTYWRNQAVPSILLFDWDVQRDEEGLAAINRLDDLSLLNDEDSAAGGARFELVNRAAWELSGGPGQPPGRLGAVLTMVRDAVGSTGRLSLRRWTSYVISTCNEVNQAPLRTPSEVERAAAESLYELELFPDVDLFASDAAARSRLARNVNVSAGRQPSGASISDDDMLERINTSDLSVALLERFGLSDPQARDRMRAVIQGGGARERAHLDLSLWLELFERRADKAGLGQIVRAAIAEQSADRLAEFDELDVEAGLDHSEQFAAERLLRAEPPEGARPLLELLPSRIRRRVEKVAFPDAQIEPDPLRAVLHALSVLDDEADGNVHLSLEGLPESGPWSRWLFAYLYGPTLAGVRDQVDEARLTLEIDERLLDVRSPRDAGAEDEFDTSQAWAPLRLVVAIPGVGVRRFRWDPLGTPGLTAFAALLNGYEVAPGEDVDCDLDTLFERLNDPRDWDRAIADTPQPSGEISNRLTQLRTKHFARWGKGIDADAIEQYLAEWEPLLNDARQTLVPANAPDRDLAAVVLTDVLQLAQGRLVMLATHPLRLRWLARHLRRMSQLLVRCLTVGLDLNAENSELFFEWLQRVSPHRTPPLIVGPDETVAVAVRESGGHEEYVPLRQHGRESRDWLSAVDDAAVEELVKVIASYVETYPHKHDGLSLLLLDREGSPRLPLRLARRVRARIPNIRFELLVFADPLAHHDIVRAFDAEFADDEVRDERLLPGVQLVLREWMPDTEPDLAAFTDRVDLALAPALFGTRTTLNQKTRDASAGLSGSYDPWIHRSTHDLEESSQNVVRAMLPSQRDPLLETWSTLCVRHDAHSAVAPQQVANTDYFEMQVRFDRHQRLFVGLHKVAHWVVTLDAFIGRDQIDALDDKPDVILVKPGVGKNEAYTLIVSSATGRRFVVKRLARKLREIRVVDDYSADATAERIYEVGRNVVPGAVLRALGLGSATNEIVGLVASRFAVARQKPVRCDRPGLEVWLSFDEQQNWFGRAQRTRADLGRFVLTLDEQDEVWLDVLVVESKFRQAFDVGAAEQQLDRTTELCVAAFHSGDSQPDDREFWLQELASAIEQTSAVRQPASELPARRRFDLGRESLEATVLSALRSGRVSLDSVQGVAVAVAAASEETAPQTSTLGAHELIRLNRPELRTIIADLLAVTDPSAAAAVQNATPASIKSSTTRDDETRQHSRPPLANTEGPHQAKSAKTAVAGARAAARGLGESELVLRYERLLDVFSQHNVPVAPATTEPWLEGPGFYVLRVAPRTGVTVDRVVNRVNEIALALQLPAGHQIRTSLDRGTIVFEVPKTEGERYPVLARDLWQACPVATGRLLVPLGADISGQPIQLDFSSPDSPHLLVAGTTGSGKSVALDTILHGLCRYPAESLRLRLVDPKGTELLDFEDDPHTDGPIGGDASDALGILEDAVAEMQRRYELMRPLRTRDLVQFNAAVEEEEDRRPWIVIVLDEYADLTSDPDDKSQIEGLLRRLTQKARAAGIHVIAATQRPSADVISTTIRSNLPAQLALRVKTATDSRIILDEGGAEALAGQGDALFRTARGLQRLQIAWTG